MKKFYLINFVFLLLSGCVAGEYNGPPMDVSRDNSLVLPHSVTTSSEVARVGDTSQRFELRGSDCKGTDCEMDRRRFELIQTTSNDSSVGDEVWYGWSMYLPTDFADISPSNTLLGQVKLVRWRSQLFNIGINESTLVVDYRPRGAQDSIWCRAAPLSQIRGKWTDIVIYANLNYDNPTGQPMFQAWINGRLVCSSIAPLITREMVEYTQTERIYFKYGIYNSYVSRWLNDHKTQSVSANGWGDYHVDSGATNNSIAARPFEIDWGVELPTQVVYYDEVRIGRTREDVDVRLRYPN